MTVMPHAGVHHIMVTLCDGAPLVSEPGRGFREHSPVAFKKQAPGAPPPADPEQLYRAAFAGRDGAPPALWVHQGDVLRAWHTDHRESTDVAIELPTGAGKSLVGGLIGEWRRRTHGERVAYLCPTRQLAQQTAEKLSSYGIPLVLLTGRAVQWNPADRVRYTNAQAIAVSVYSHVFNSNPALSDAQVLLLDDAHAAEGYVAGPWSLSIDRADAAYQDVLSTLTDAFDPLVLARLRTDNSEGKYNSTSYLASPVGVAAAAGQLEQVLSTAATTSGIDRSARHALTKLTGHLDRCMVYASYRSLLIRPLIPPTGTHTAFEAAKQRVYMSATLGAGGELERAFGRRTIKRIPTPKGWEKQGTGRRFFCFPQLTTDLSRAPDEADAWIKDVLREHGKAVVLTPDTRAADQFRAHRVPDTAPLFDAAGVEEDLNVFATASQGALVLNNRYDGIDLPDDACRLVIIDGLPARGDLQERFLYGALGALEVLQERIRARIVQGSGRATRNSGDYAAVLVLGNDLTSFVSRQDVQAAMHPEVHAELAFGLDNSLDIDSTEMRENLRAFATQNADWRSVDEHIRAARDQLDRIDPPGSAELQAAAAAEVAAWLAAWQGEWDRALDQARRVLDALRGGQAPQRYAALWNYLAACWALRLATGDSALRSTSADYYRAARAAGRGTTWLSYLESPVDRAIESTAPAADPVDATAAAAIHNSLPTMGRPAAFDTQVSAARAGLAGTEAHAYENALAYMGRLAGAEPSEGNGSADAAPDATWIFSSVLWVCWEAKSDARADGELGADDVRQAGGHLRYAATQRELPIPSGSVSLLMTPQARVHNAAKALAEDHVFLVRPPDVVDVFDRLVRAWRTLRARGEAITVEDVLTALNAERALPSRWLAELTQVPLANG